MGVCGSSQVTPVPHTTAQNDQLNQLQSTIVSTIQEEVRKTFTSPASVQLIKNAVSDAISEHSTQHSATTENPSQPDIEKKLVSLFDEQRRVFTKTFTQQVTPSAEFIKQAVLDALTEPNASATTSRQLHHGSSNRKKTHHNSEVKITANLEQTRIDAAFIQQRDAVVEDKQLRNYVREWSKVDSMNELCVKIKASGKNDLKRAWLLFCWIGENIRYKYYCKENAAESVFRTRQGVCRGYVSLYHECCSLLNITCSEISGYTKQEFLKSNQVLEDSKHAWNAIVLDNHTYLLDSTWGAGGGDGANQLEDFYFLTSPEQLIYTHYSNGFQLLSPELTKQEFLSLPIMKSTYYRLKMNLISPKQGFNETDQTIFKIDVQTPNHVSLMAVLKVNDTEYPRNLHTFCQRDVTHEDIYHCYVAPPVDGLYEVIIYAKARTEDTYRDTIYMRLNVSNIVQAITFPTVYQPFQQYNCILIEPLHRLVYEDERVLIHMIIPNANVVKIQVGTDYIVPNKDEFKKGLLKKEVFVQGDIHVCARWDDKADSISTVCVFNMISKI